MQRLFFVAKKIRRYIACAINAGRLFQLLHNRENYMQYTSVKVKSVKGNDAMKNIEYRQTKKIHNKKLKKGESA